MHATKIPEAHSHPPVKCAGCRAEVVACSGVHGSWMHEVGRRETCPAGGYARPQTVADINREKRAS